MNACEALGLLLAAAALWAVAFFATVGFLEVVR